MEEHAKEVRRQPPCSIQSSCESRVCRYKVKSRLIVGSKIVLTMTIHIIFSLFSGLVAFSHRFEAVKSFFNGEECEGIKPMREMMIMMQKVCVFLILMCILTALFSC